MYRIRTQISLVCIAGLSVLACGHDQASPEDRNQIEFRINNLGFQTGHTWTYTCRSLIVDYGDLAVPQLIEGLGSLNAQIRRGCAYSLGHIGHPDAVDPLENSLGDPDLLVRLEAAASLCMFKKYEGVPLLILALRHEQSPLIRVAAYQTLARAFSKELKWQYEPQGSADTREAGVQQFEAWWSANKSRYLAN